MPSDGLMDADAVQSRIAEGVFNMAGDTENSQALVSWRTADADYPRDKTIQALFEEQVELTPHAVAIEFEDRRLSYAELNEQANRVAHRSSVWE